MPAPGPEPLRDHSCQRHAGHVHLQAAGKGHIEHDVATVDQQLQPECRAHALTRDQPAEDDHVEQCRRRSPDTHAKIARGFRAHRLAWRDDGKRALDQWPLQGD